MLTVDVTQEDIDAPCNDLSRDCILARAISRALGEPVRVFGYSDGTYWEAQSGDGRRKSELPPVAYRAAINWQQGERVNPFAFSLAALSPEAR